MGRPKKDRSQEIQKPERPKDPKKSPKNTSIDKILKQRGKNPLMTITDQAKLNGVSKQSLSQLLKRHGIDVDAAGEYKEHRADLFAGIQDTVLGHIDSTAIKRMVEKAPMAAVSLFGVLYDKERLERGQSTSNVATILASHVIEAGKQWGKKIQGEAIEAETVEM